MQSEINLHFPQSVEKFSLDVSFSPYDTDEFTIKNAFNTGVFEARLNIEKEL